MASVLRETHAHRVADGAVDDLADVEPAERAHRVGHRLRVDAGARDGLAVDGHGERVHAGDLLGAYVLRAGDAPQRADHVIGGLPELAEIVPVEMDREVRRNARQEIVGVHLDGLAEGERSAGDALAQGLVEFLDEALARVRGLPLLLGLEHDVDVAHVHAHGVDGDLGASRTAHDAGHLGELEERFLHLACLLRRLLEGHRRQPDHRRDHRSFVELGQEFASHLGGAADARDEREERREDHELRPAEPHAQRRRVDTPYRFHHRRRPITRRERQYRRRDGRHEREREDERCREREEHRHGHGAEHAALDALQREDGHVDERDDHLAERGRAPDLGRRGEHHLAPLGVDEGTAELLAPLRHATKRVLHDDDRAVHHEAEVDRAKAHQVARHAERPHPDERPDERQRDGHRHDGASAQIDEREEEDDEHEQARLDQVGRDGLDRAIDELRAVVVRVDDDPGRQRLLDRRDGVLHVVDHLPRVGAAQHHDHADDSFFLATVARDRTVTDDRRLLDLAEVPHVERRAPALALHDHVSEVVRGADAALAADRHRLASISKIGSAARDVVPLDGRRDLGDADAGGGHLARIDGELEAPSLAAERVHLHDAGHELQPRRDLPVEDGAAIHERQRALHLEMEDLAEAARDRTKLR